MYVNEKIGKATIKWNGGSLTTCRECQFLQGPVVRKPINVNPGLKVNRGFHLAR